MYAIEGDGTTWAISQGALMEQLRSEGEGLANLLGESVNLWRAVKAFTAPKSDARKIIMGVDRENGLTAWQGLHQRFSKALAAKQGMVQAEFSTLISKPATSHLEPYPWLLRCIGEFRWYVTCGKPWNQVTTSQFLLVS